MIFLCINFNWWNLIYCTVRTKFGFVGRYSIYLKYFMILKSHTFQSMFYILLRTKLKPNKAELKSVNYRKRVRSFCLKISKIFWRILLVDWDYLNSVYYFLFIFRLLFLSKSSLENNRILDLLCPMRS
jgi:hypothetical protein